MMTPKVGQIVSCFFLETTRMTPEADSSQEFIFFGVFAEPADY
jgi:hypothetical protein